MGFTVDSNGRVIEERENKEKQKREGGISSSTGLSYARIFGYMFLGLLITALVAFGLGFLFFKLIGASGEGFNTGNKTALTVYLAVMIGSAVVLLIDSIVLNVVLIKGRHSLVVPSLIYVVAMGVLLSSFTLIIDWRVLGLSFGITSAIFGVMALIAILSKGNLSGLAIAGFGLFIGAGIMALFNWIMMIALPGTWTSLYWIISFICLAAMMLITIYDMWRIKKICERGEMTPNLELYCAYNLYVDFIYIFIRIVLIIASSKK